MAEYSNGAVIAMDAGDYTVQYIMSTGTAQLKMADPSDADSTATLITDTDKSASAAFNLTLCGRANVTVVLTGDAKCFILNRTAT